MVPLFKKPDVSLFFYIGSSVLFYTIALYLLSSNILPEHTAVFASTLGASLSWVLYFALFGSTKRTEDKPSEATPAHFVCSGLLLGFSRFFEFASLARIHPITHEAMWALIPLFYILASESWKDLQFEYHRTTWTLSTLVIGMIALIFVAVGNEVEVSFGIIYAIAWIVTKAYYIIYTHYIRIALGAEPGKIHLWSNVVATVFAGVLSIVDCKRMSSSGSSIVWFLVLILVASFYGFFYHHYDSEDLKANASQKPSYRCQIRMFIFGIVGSFVWPATREYNYVAFVVSCLLAFVYKYLHINKNDEVKNEEGENSIVEEGGGGENDV